MLYAGPLLEVADGQLDRGMVPVELVDLHRRQFNVGDERMWRQLGHSRSWAGSLRQLRRTTSRSSARVIAGAVQMGENYTHMIYGIKH